MRFTPTFLLCFLLALPAAGAPRRDDWFTSDKPRHFAVCFALTGAGYGAGALLFEDPALRWLTGAGLGLGVGVGKELYDKARGKTFSLQDLTWDTAGTVTGLVTAFIADRFITELLLTPRTKREAVSGRVAVGRGGLGGGSSGVRATLDELDEQLTLRVGDEHGYLLARTLLHAAGGLDADALGEASLGELESRPSGPGLLLRADTPLRAR
jgi:uncharacterized protein YfiM (DUF2279 family)